VSVILIVLKFKLGWLKITPFFVREVCQQSLKVMYDVDYKEDPTKAKFSKID